MSSNGIRFENFKLEECKILSQLDSLEYGFTGPDAQDRVKLLEKAVLYFDSIIARIVLELEQDRAQTESDCLTNTDYSARDEESSIIRYRTYEQYLDRFHQIIDPKIYLLLGHFHLLLNRFDDAFSAYSKYESLCPEEAERNCLYLYGLGLCCFRFNAFHRTLSLFYQILYLEPWFQRAKEIHIRIGYIYKLHLNFEKGLHHFKRALKDYCPATFSSVEIRFHIGHLFEVCGKTNQARREYHRLLDTQSSNTPSHIRHLCLRHLAWLHHTRARERKTEETTEKDLDVHWLQSALELDSTNGKTWYLLGRCLASLNRVQEAFAAYRSSIDKTEASADTWCSIGVLYQEQSQPMDALQAYFCAVQLDKCHVAAWANLGTLYESTQQYKEALKCYKNASIADKNDELKPEVRSRLELLQQIVPCLPEKFATGTTTTSGTTGTNNNSSNGTTKLPTVDEAWSLPIPAELTQRQLQLVFQESSNSTYENTSSGLRDDNYLKTLLSAQPFACVLKNQKRQNSDDYPKPSPDDSVGTKKSRRDSSPPAAPLTAQQSQLLATLQAQETSLNASQRQLLTQLNAQALRFHQHKLSKSPNGNADSDELGFTTVTSSSRQVATHISRDKVSTTNSVATASDPGTLTECSGSVDLFSGGDDGLPPVVGSPGTDQLPEDDLAFLTDDLLAQLNRSETAANLDLVEFALFANSTTTTNAEHSRPASNNRSVSRTSLSHVEGASCDTRDSAKSELLSKTELSSTADSHASLTSPIGSQGQSVTMDLYAFLTRPLHTPKTVTSSLCINQSSSELLKAVSGLGRSGGPWWPGIQPEDSPIPRPPTKPYPPPPKDKLYPSAPSVYLESRKDAFSPDLVRYCSTQPCVVIRGLAAALRMDLGLFSTKRLVESHPEQRIEVRTQVAQAPDMNRDNQGRTVWYCDSPRTATTISKYATYQARSFVQYLSEEKMSHSHFTGNDATTGPKKELDTIPSDNELTADSKCKLVTHSGHPADTSESLKPFNRHAPNVSGRPTPPGSKKTKIIRFGTNCDLSDEKKWSAQLHELTKLPPLFKVVSAFNMLTHVGYPLFGMNTVQLYLKVPGCRTPGHQENNCFSAVNINIGPGDCEWFCVPEQYWGAIHDLCQKNNVDYLTGSWWPDLETLYEENIPVYRFVQRPGDLVWVNASTVHWVQAIGWCNNIAWNVGPMTARQYQMAVDRYEFNRLRGFKSIVPMIHLTWQLAKHVKISDHGLYELIKHTLMRTLVQSQLAINFIEKLGLEIKNHGKQPDDVAHSCCDCEIEVFNLLYVIAQEKKSLVRCLDCARRMDSSLQTFTILSEYRMQELSEIYDDFRLQSQPLTAYSVGKSYHSVVL